MKPFHLLLVCLRENWRDSLTDSLQSSGYVFRIKEVADKREALRACSQARYDALVTSCSLPDGSPNDLVLVLGNTIPCLVLRDGCHLGTSSSQAIFTNQLPQAPPPAHPSTAWVEMLEGTIRQWENAMVTRLDQDYQREHLLYHKAAKLCFDELHYSTENSIDNVLRIVMGVLNVSRVYIREAFTENYRSSRFVHELSAAGQVPYLGPHRSVHEVFLSESNGCKRYLGIEDTLTRRTWNPLETELVYTVATFLRTTREVRTHAASSWLNGVAAGSQLFMAS